MRRVFSLIPLFVVVWLHVASQLDAQTVLQAGEGLTAPVLLPSTLTIPTPKHCEELDGVVKFAAMVDTAGLPHELKMLETSDGRLVDFATGMVEAQRFKPATLDGSPKTVAVELTVGLHTCAQHEKHPTDGNFYQFTLSAHPFIALAVIDSPARQEVVSPVLTEVAHAEEVGGKISAPVPTVLIDPQIPVSGRLPKRGSCYLGVMIDANGIPQNIRVFHGLQPELDSYAMEAAKHWRFKPAIRATSAPAAFEETVVATFEYVDKEPVAFAQFFSEPPDKVFAAKAHGDKVLNINLEPVNADEVAARYMPLSRIAGRCLVSLLVDTHGVPLDVHIVKSLDSSLDMDTVAMVQHLRFKPVLEDGTTPAYVWIIVPVRYRVNTWKDVFYAIANISVFLFA